MILDSNSEGEVLSPTSTISPSSPPPASIAESEVSLSELEAATTGTPSEISDGVSVDSLREAALMIPDVEAPNANTSPQQSSQPLIPFNSSGILSSSSSSSGANTPIDWPALLGVSSQTLDAATTATSFGFAAARTATSFGLTFAKRLTQVLVAVPAMAVDGAFMGIAPNGVGSNSNDRNGQPSAAAIAHATVGGLFDGIAMLALGGIDVGSALTSAGLGAAGAGVEGVRRAMGSEVLRSLSAFSKLVKREWSASDLSCLPPGGLPAYSALGITRALTAWVLIQLVTRPDYERRQLKGMEEIDLTVMKKLCREELEKRKKLQEEQEKKEAEFKGSVPQETSKKPEANNVKITSEMTLPKEEGELIGATIGTSHVHGDTASQSTDSGPPEPLDTQEALLGLRRYSRLVLGVYGGVALAWLGALPTEGFHTSDPLDATSTDPVEKVSTVVDGEAPRVHPQPAPVETEEAKKARAADEVGFPRAASKLQVDSDPNLGVAAGGSGLFDDDGGVMPGAFGSTFTTEPEISTTTAPSNTNPMPTTTTSTSSDSTTGTIPPQRSGTAYSYLDLISGKHDNDLFHKTGGLKEGAATEGSYDEFVPPPTRDPNSTARTSKPRYYVVTDHEAEKICLILRGSLTVGDIAADLTCESVRWEHAGEDSADWESRKGWEIGDSTENRLTELKTGSSEETEGKKEEIDMVHEGIYLTAQEIGLPGRPVHRAVSRALTLNPTYSLDICGHSLGAGCAALLALMWGSTETGLTHSKSGLPINRKIHAYCFAVPCVSNQHLSKRMRTLVTSFVVSYDLVSRLSLGSVLDVRNACAWLCYEDEQSRLNPKPRNEDSNLPISSMAPPPPFTLNSFTQKAFKHQASQLNESVKEEFEIEALSLRKTLEANMNGVELFPPGTVLVSFPQNGFLTQTEASKNCRDEQFRVFRVKDKANFNDVFGQIQFVSGMLSDHMPQTYNNCVHNISS